MSAVALAGGLLGLAGCTSDAAPTPEPLPSRSASPSPSPSATPPSLPAEAEGTSPAAAKAFARHYFDLINYAARTGDTADLRAASAHECVSCDAIAGNIEEIYEAGGHIQGQGWELRLVRELKTAQGRSTLSLGVFLNTEAVISSSGNEERHESRRQPMTMHLASHSGAFKVQRLDLVS